MKVLKYDVIQGNIQYFLKRMEEQLKTEPNTVLHGDLKVIYHPKTEQIQLFQAITISSEN